MSLFTIHFQFGGTTAVAQTSASKPQQAAQKWIHSLQAATIPGLGTKGKTILAGEIRRAAPLPVRSVASVWAYHAPINGLLALVYLTQTEEGPGKGKARVRAKAAGRK